MTTSPLVSIVLPTHNGARYIEQAIASCLQQTHANFELIVVDDASVDDTWQIINRFAAADPRVRPMKHSANRRLPGALNTGFGAARGEFYTWISDDNQYRPAAIAEMVAFLQSHPEVGLVYTDYTIIDADGRLVEKVRVLAPEEVVFGNCIGPSFLYRRQVGETVGAYAEDVFLAEDYEYWLRVSILFPLALLHRDLYAFRVHDSSLSQQYYSRVRQVVESAWHRHLPQMHWVCATRKGRLYYHLANARLKRDRLRMLKYILLIGLISPRTLCRFARIKFKSFCTELDQR